MKYGLIGEKLGHSFSASIHSALGMYEYELCPIEREKLALFMQEKNFLGINVTIPYKKDVIPFLDAISPEAALCGAVNTVVNRGGVLTGYNTDLSGMQALLERAGIEIKGKNVLILGTGGTSGTALALCKKLGAKTALRVSRSQKEGAILYDRAKDRKETQVIINTTPCGMYPDLGKCPIDLSFFPALEGVADAIYNPLKSALVLEGEKRGIPSVGGLYMLVAQAIFAAEHFTGKEGLLGECDAIYEALRKEKENIVLVGMPGCGKSTLGRILAQKRGLSFVDSDEEIIKEEKKSIPQIFREVGEEGFRQIESRVIRSLSSRQGCVIATGGGAVLREENVSFLKHNGRLIFLDAPLETLSATSDRPLSSDALSLERRYKERYGIYCKVAHITVPVSRDTEENILSIEKELV